MKKLFHVCLIACLYILPATGSAQFKVWEKRLYGQGESVAINPLNPNTIFAQAGNGWLNVSRDKGETWTAVSSGIPWTTREIIVHPNDTLTMFAVAFSSGLFKSTNGGVTWNTVIANFGIDGESVTYDPVHPDTMYAGNFFDGTLYRSSDRGTTWIVNGVIGTNLCALAVRPDSANILLAGSGNGRISKSTNSGVSWRLVKSAGSTEIPRIVIDPANPQVAYGTAYEGNASVVGVWKTTNGGESWALTSLQQIDVWSMDISMTNPNVLYVGTFDEYGSTIYKTTDAGGTWQPISRGLLPYNSVWNIKIDPTDENVVYASVTDGAFGFNGIYRLSFANAGVEGIIRDSLTNSPITSGTVAISGVGSSINLSTSLGAYSFFRFPPDAVSIHTFSVTINSSLFKQEVITLISDSIQQRDILVPPGSISGTVFNDVNGDGIQNFGEPGLPGWTILMTGQAPGSAISDANGNYILNDLFPGTYTISEQSQTGWKKTAPPTNYSATITNANRVFLEKNFGNIRKHRVVSVSPTPFSLTSASAIEIIAVFDTSINTSLVNDTLSWIVCGSVSGRMTGSFTYVSGNATATFTPAASFHRGEVVTVNLTKRLKTAAGDSITPFSFEFSIGTEASPGSVLSKTNYQSGSNPYGVAAGDIDRDGDADLVTSNVNANTVSVIKNSGNGTFVGKVDFPAGPNPQTIVLADIDNDGDLDVITGNAGSLTISVLKNNGSGIFAAKDNYSTAVQPGAVAARDVDGDGFVDIVTSGLSTTLVTLLRNNGSGAFPTQQNSDVGSAVWGSGVADMNADGSPDVVAVASVGPSSAHVLKNIGEGILAPDVSFNLGNGARSIIAADVTSDNSPDLLVTSTSPSQLSLIPNDGLSYGSRVDIGLAQTPWGLASGDLDGDGRADVVVTSPGSNLFSVMKNMGSNVFTPVSYSTISGPRAVALADLDNDGDLDVVIANSTIDSVSVYLNSIIANASHTDGWNLVSLPLRPADPRSSRVYTSSISSTFAYEGSYTSIETLRTGVGYWIKFATAGIDQIHGSPLTADTIPLRGQWNMIGGLHDPILVASIVTNPPGIISSNYFGFDAGYQIVDTLEPGKGYWVKTTSPGLMMLSSMPSQVPRNTIRARAEVRADHELTFEDARGNHQTLFFDSGIVDDARLARFEKPPVFTNDGAFDVRYESGKMLVGRTQNRNPLVKIEMRGAVFPVKISWQGILPSSTTWSLSVGGARHELSVTGSLTLASAQSLTLESGAFQASTLPTDVGLDQNYPNPFNPTTTLRYALPIAGRVTLIITDVLGADVARLVDDRQEPGYHVLDWSPTVSSGIYFYTLTVVSEGERSQIFRLSKKLMLVK